MRIQPKPGLNTDQPRVSAAQLWALGFNVRFRLGRAETLGFIAPFRETSGQTITLPGAGPYLSLENVNDDATGQLIAASGDRVILIDFDPSSTAGTGTRWRTSDITPDSFGTGGITPPSPSRGVVPIIETTTVLEQDDLVVLIRNNTTSSGPWVWDRDPATPAAPIANAPTGAVGGAIVQRILVLLGAASLTDPDPARFLTVRWSGQNDFEDWTPTDINVSGELQVSGGARIMGGGLTRFGIAVFTDGSLTMLSYTGDFGSIFSPQAVEGATGLLANGTWCESDAVLWWMSGDRNLMAFDGGAPRPIPNPLKSATIDRLSDEQLALATLTANPEFNEVVLSYASEGATIPDRQLTYNYVDDAWSLWTFERGCWAKRRGIIPFASIDGANQLLAHDLDGELAEAYLTVPGIDAVLPDTSGPAIQTIPTQDIVIPQSFALTSNVISTEALTESTWRTTRAHVDYVEALPRDATSRDTITAHFVGYGEARVEGSEHTVDNFYMTLGLQSGDVRVSGKGVLVGLYGIDVRTQYRFGAITLTAGQGGTR